MAKKTVKNKGSAGGTLTISLFDPGMTDLHRVGLAGLWMTLKALEEESGGVKGFNDGNWERDTRSVSFSWRGDSKPFFEELFKKSFSLKNGLFYFPALGDPQQNPSGAIALQAGLLGTFLQHPQHSKKGRREVLSLEVDGRNIPQRFHAITRYEHQRDPFSPFEENPIKGWQYPGAGVRHWISSKETVLRESAGCALALRYALIGSVYYKLSSKGKKNRPQFAVVVPAIKNLEQFAANRALVTRLGAHEFLASRAGEAGLRVLIRLAAGRLVEDLEVLSCRVISFGTAPWASQQRTRMEVVQIGPGGRGDRFTAYKNCLHLFSPTLQQYQNGDFGWNVPQIPGFVANNLIENRLWWEGFADFYSDADIRKQLNFHEKGGLAEMVETMITTGPEKVFVTACHEAWRRRMAQIGEKAKREGSDFNSQINREFERLRVAFSRCKNSADLRQAVTDFWARGGGQLKPLQEGWREVLTLMDHQHWRLAKDLVLLALVSYKTSNPKEDQAVVDQSTESGGQS